MARAYGRIFTSIWNNADFVDLSYEAQWEYFMMVTQPNLNYAGVVPFTPQRWATYARNMTGAKISRALDELADGRFVLADRTTEEVMIRTFLRHGGVLGSPNMLKASARDRLTILSAPLRGAVLAGVPPDQRPVFESATEGLPEGLPEGIEEGLGEGLPEGFKGGSRAHVRGGTKTKTQTENLDLDKRQNPGSSASTSSNGSNGSAPAVAGCASDDEAFRVLIDRWPEVARAREPRARQAWKKALAEADVTAEVILQGLPAWLQHWARPEMDEQFIPYPATWLADRDWARPPPRPRASKGARKDADLIGELGQFAGRDEEDQR